MIRQAVHQAPVWRDRSNFIIAATVTDGGGVETEQLWVRREEEFRFEICCIPFFVYDLALGDVVETDNQFLVRRVVKHSGRYVFRVWFGDSFQPRDETAAELVELGALLEWSSRNLLAVAAADHEQAQIVADFLAEGERAGRYEYEAGRR